MSLIVVPREENDRFQVEQVTTALIAVEGVRDLISTPTTIMQLQWTFSDGKESCFGRLQQSGEAIHIDPESRLAAQLVIAIRNGSPFDLDLIDDQYTFHLALGDFQSTDDLWNAIQLAYKRSTDGPRPYQG